MRAARLIDSLNGVTIAYAMGVVNAALAMLFAFGVSMTQDQRGYVSAFVNAALVLVAHVSHSQAKRNAPPTPPAPEGET